MFIVSLSYKAPLAEIDASLEAHIKFLDRHFATGAFLTSGPKEPRTGGVILATITNRDELDLILSEDPFRKLGLASYKIEQFHPNRFAASLPNGLRRCLAAAAS